MKLALVKLPATYADWYSRPVLGLAYIAAYVKREGIECKIFDAYYSHWNERVLLRALLEYDADVVGITAMTHEVTRAAALAAKLKESGRPRIIIGGCHVTAMPENTLLQFPAFDYGIRGEGEKATVELLRHIGQGTEPASVKGLVYRNAEGAVLANEPGAFLEKDELDALPFPEFTDYYGDDRKALARGGATYAMFTSRGCPYRCVFCMQVLGHKVRRRSPANIIAEMDYAIDRWGARCFDFADEIFLFDTSDTRKLLEMFIDRGFPERISWVGLTRANLVNPELIALAKKAGCRRLAMGVESGDDEILKRINKGITISQVREAVRIIKSSGISLSTYYILGHPGDTPQTVQKTIDLAVELNTNSIAVGIMVPYPGTKIYDLALHGEAGYRLLTQDWSSFDKYGSQAMEIAGLPHDYLTRLQRTAILKLYVKNLRLLDCVRYFWERRKALLYFAGMRLRRLLGFKHKDEAPAAAKT
ncbi:MAG TPA: radical SAM protein [Planctomycetota bacterium]|nr:radical SAM protein [Planctomycetota bacterium]